MSTEDMVVRSGTEYIQPAGYVPQDVEYANHVNPEIISGDVDGYGSVEHREALGEPVRGMETLLADTPLNVRSEFKKIPLLNSEGDTDYENYVNAQVVRPSYISPMGYTDEPYDYVESIAASTTVYISARKDDSGWSGSGVIVDPRDLPINPDNHPPGTLFILTCQHVEGDGADLYVTMPDGSETEAEVLYSPHGSPLTDKIDDVALIAIHPKNPQSYPMARLGSSGDVTMGDEVLVSGHPLGLPQQVMTWGRITQPEAETGYIAPGLQTDAAINPGNSGGPMFNMNGEVIGLNTYGFLRAENTAFAQPIDVLMDDLIEIYTTGKKVRGYMGVHLKPFPLRDRKEVGFTWENGYDDETGALVEKVDIITMLFTGIRMGDVVTSMDIMLGDKLIESFDVNYTNRFQEGLMKRKIYNLKPGMYVVYHVYRPKEDGGFEKEKLIKVPVIGLPQDVYDAEGMKIFERFMRGVK